MYQARTRRPFIVEIKSARRTARNKELASIWAGVDIDAAKQAINGERVERKFVAANAIAEHSRT